MARRAGQMLMVVAVMLLCASCHVDVNVDVTMAEDGSGTVTVTAIADADIVAQAPDLANDLRFTDAEAAGWSVEEPAPTADGGLQVVLTHDFTSPAQANAILAGLNGPSGPLVGVTFARSASGRTTTFTISGTLQVTGGLDAYSDADVLAAVGATPYATQAAAAAVDPASAVTFGFEAHLPGTVQNTTAIGGEGLRWQATTDGTAVDLASATKKQRPENVWAGPLATGAKIAFAAWCVIAIGFIAYVVIVRRRRAAVRALR